MTILITLLVLLTLLLIVTPLRQRLISAPLFTIYKRILPSMSDTERIALEAGTVWWEGELFRGQPDWHKLHTLPKPTLRPDEVAFIENECNTACALVNDWRATTQDGNLSKEAWQFIKDKGFLGMIIPKRYGGLEFSAFAHSEVITRLSTRSSALAVSVMVPNSLGPAELLLHYGTDAQKDHYLPRLARGEEIPAFALTSPWAGSDAAAIPDVGIVCKGQWQGQEVLGMRVTWDKRYITLAPVCTLLGLAFHLFDPEHLLGDKTELGITCALVPDTHPGVDIGRRHMPLNGVFMNGPTRGQDVFMPLDFIIGGAAKAGQGWRMLMECLAAGRSISLPSSNTGMAEVTAYGVGAYARVRQQFKLSVGYFQGVEEALARIAGHTYLADAARQFTAGSIDLGERPSVASAIVKYHVTEKARQVVNDGMDVIGGKGICLGPSNWLGRAYQQVPIGITVEGANILTRSLILFGQGAIRCHPFVQKEMAAAKIADPQLALREFDTALFAHVRYTVVNFFRAIWLAFSDGRLSSAPTGIDSSLRRYYQRMNRYSAALALLADVAMLSYGGALKKEEKISARLGDILSELYLSSAALKRYADDGQPSSDRPLLYWAVSESLHRAHAAMAGIVTQFQPRWIGVILRLQLLPWGRATTSASDALGQQVAQLLLTPSPTQSRLTQHVFLPAANLVENEPIAALREAWQHSLNAEPLDAKIRAAEKAGKFTGNPLANVRDIALAAHAAGIINESELVQLQERNRLRDIVIRVDDFEQLPLG